MGHNIAPARSLKISASPGISNILHGFSAATSLANPPAPTGLLYPTTPLLPHDLIFNVVVRGQLFKLNYDQIMYDQPNIFTTAFLEGFLESDSRQMNILGRSPAMFSVIYEYLSGYAILPNPDIDLRNLLSDCEYYGLQRLKDELTLPKLGDALSSRHKISRVVRLEDLASRQPPSVEWTDHGLMDGNDLSKHLLVFVTKAHLSLDLVVKTNGEWCVHPFGVKFWNDSLAEFLPLQSYLSSSQASFAIELPPYASKPLHLTGENPLDWTAVTAESLSSSPFTLNDNEFEGNFGDLVRWIRSFINRNSVASSSTSAPSILVPEEPEHIGKLTKAMPGLAETLRVRVSQGQNSLPLSTTFFASEISLIIAPPDSFDPPSSHIDSLPTTNNLVAKILNCSLSTGLHRRKFLKALVNL